MSRDDTFENRGGRLRFSSGEEKGKEPLFGPTVKGTGGKRREGRRRPPQWTKQAKRARQ